jgi:FixJ family two-component response regulator
MIAIVDDDEAVRVAMKTLVRSLGYSAATFASADEFLNSQVIRDTSCLVTDVQMPGTSGVDLQDRLSGQGHRIPIIFITACPDENVRVRAMKAGAIGFFIKPCSGDHLRACVEKALRTDDAA